MNGQSKECRKTLFKRDGFVRFNIKTQFEYVGKWELSHPARKAVRVSLQQRTYR